MSLEAIKKQPKNPPREDDLRPVRNNNMMKQRKKVEPTKAKKADRDEDCGAK
jgi:hypothetical protein